MEAAVRVNLVTRTAIITKYFYFRFSIHNVMHAGAVRAWPEGKKQTEYSSSTRQRGQPTRPACFGRLTTCMHARMADNSYGVRRKTY